MDLIEIKGKINTAICYARVVEDEAIEQIRRMCDYPMTEGSRIRIMESFVSWEDRPMACSMDICVTKDGRTLLVEFNDAYSLGAYGLADIYYAKLISARWSQLLGVKDEYHF